MEKSNKKYKKIYFEYLTIDEEEYLNNKVRIAKNQPKFDDYKELYLYEIFTHDFLEDKIKNQLRANYNDCQFYDSFLIQLTNEQFDEIKYLFDTESILEKEKWDSDFKFLNAKMSILKLSPKFWDV